MSKIEVKDLLDAGVHFGHLTRKWNPNMAPFIYMERNGIHIINLYKSVAKIEEANEALKKIAASGRKILFVATKKQAKDIVAEKVANVNMPYITERWPGGMLTNFVTIRKAVKKMAAIAETFNAQVAPHLYAGPIEWAANIHLGVSIPNFLIAETIETEFHKSLISSSIIVENGYIAAPSQSGLGIEVNETLARAHPYTGTRLHLEMSPLPNAYRSQ